MRVMTSRAGTGDTPLWPLYLGGFLGPFGSPVVTTMLPELAGQYDVSVQAASTSLTAYLLPFAALMLVSGTLAERFGRRRTVQVGYIVYALASVACALAPTFELFILFRILQGASNAFTTPVLVAAITDVVAPGQLGRSLGLFGSMQATGQAMSPLAGGIAADLNWRIAFFAIAVVSVLLAFLPPGDAKHPYTGRQIDRWRMLANRQLLLACVAAALAFLTTMGMAVVAALFVRDEFNLSPFLSGVVVALFGVAGLLTGRWSGSLIDKYGKLVIGGVSHLLLGAFCSLTGFTTLAGPVVGLGLALLTIAASGAASTATRSVAQTLAVTSAPQNRSGATSVMLACQFSGAALVPFTWVPLYNWGGGTQASHILAMVVAGSTAMLAGVLLLVLHRAGYKTR